MQTPISLLFAQQSKQTVAASSEVASPSLQPTAPNLQTLNEQIEACTQCPLSQQRTAIIVGQGHEDADILIVSEAPTMQHEQSPAVFSGDAGILINAILETPALSHLRTYQVPLIQCATSQHHTPSTDELAACSSWLEQQIALIQPKVILLMGRMAAQTILRSEVSLHALHGQWHEYQGIATWVSYHPSHLLYAPRQKQTAWLDMQEILKKLQTDAGNNHHA